MHEDTYMESPYSKASIESLFKLLHGDRKMLPPELSFTPAQKHQLAAILHRLKHHQRDLEILRQFLEKKKTPEISKAVQVSTYLELEVESLLSYGAYPQHSPVSP